MVLPSPATRPLNNGFTTSVPWAQPVNAGRSTRPGTLPLLTKLWNGPASRMTAGAVVWQFGPTSNGTPLTLTSESRIVASVREESQPILIFVRLLDPGT